MYELLRFRWLTGAHFIGAPAHVVDSQVDDAVLKRVNPRVAATRVARGVFVAVALIAVAVLVGTPSRAPLFADPGVDPVGVDSDGDGLADNIETQFGSSIGSSDSDGDGVSDFLEILLGSDATLAASTPTTDELNRPAARVLGYIEGENFHFYTSLFSPRGDLGQFFNLGSVIYLANPSGMGPLCIPFDAVVLSGAVTAQSYPVGSAIFSCDSWIPVSFLPLLFDPGAEFQEFTVSFAADFLDASATSGITTVCNVAMFATTTPYDFSADSLAYLPIEALHFGKGSGSFRPLQAVNIPQDWIPDSVCVVSTSVQGADGPLVVLKTDSASCETFEGSFCGTASCQAQVGRVYTTINPLALAGGL